MNRIALALTFIVLLGLAGCTRSAATPDAPPLSLPTVTPASAGLPTLAPQVTPTPAQAEIPTLAPTLGAFEPFEVKAMVNNLNVRTGPGMVFPALLMVNEGDALKVFGIAPGGEWLDVETPSGARGWVFGQLIETGGVSFSAVPQVEPGNVLKITGRILDVSGTPIQGVVFSFVQGSARSDARTDQGGWFYIFLPSTASGSWDVSYTAIACESNVWADATCAGYKAGYQGVVEPAFLTVTLPLSTDQPLNFVWK